MAFPLVDEIFIELQRASTKKKHGFKTFVFRSGNSIRTVVLRKVNRVDKTLWIFTDKRTQKIIEIAKDGKVGCLFWDGKIGYQLRIKANATVHLEGEKRNEAFSRVHDQSLSDYATVQAPGTEISEPQEVKWEMENAQKNFALVEIQPYLIDYLKLGKPHQRALLTSENQWKTQWITP